MFHKMGNWSWEYMADTSSSSSIPGIPVSSSHTIYLFYCLKLFFINFMQHIFNGDDIKISFQRWRWWWWRKKTATTSHHKLCIDVNETRPFFFPLPLSSPLFWLAQSVYMIWIPKNEESQITASQMRLVSRIRIAIVSASWHIYPLTLTDDGQKVTMNEMATNGNKSGSNSVKQSKIFSIQLWGCDKWTQSTCSISKYNFFYINFFLNMKYLIHEKKLNSIKKYLTRWVFISFSLLAFLKLIT